MPYGICPPGPAAPLLQARGPLLHVLQDALPPRTRRASGKRMTAPSAPLVTTAGQERAESLAPSRRRQSTPSQLACPEALPCGRAAGSKTTAPHRPEQGGEA